MFTLVHLDTPPPEALKSQVLEMVVDYFSDISPVPLTPSNPLYQLYQYVIGFEVHLYLQAMDSTQPHTARLLLALDDEDPSQVLGFALYLPSEDDTEACTLAYMAVKTSHRRRGIARALLQQITARRPHLELACATAKVPTFEALGLQVVTAQGPHVVLSTRNYRSAGMVAVQDLAPIYQSQEVRQIHAYLLKQNGNKAMSEAESKRDRLLDQMAYQAEMLVKERFPTIH
ncbi:GNAT family N-acetyltransferase [Pseudomonas turukhanskensis]|uniref:N-acetyltransferase n=1 Tax=Pseudomonas turukhanskensis TaxID=1806536 RepID=A0A9W6K569_9PSED|nr:GNAT family N-acetyltransferase [Pseudomonas turukhanskensis]GLK88458.1 N-acetyltransferase [Pseudomonas turukhanskensis]